MKLQIYYYQQEGKLEDIQHLLDEVSEEAVQEYLETRWRACIPSIPADGKGKTKEEARENVIKNAYDSIAFYLKKGQAKLDDYLTLSIEDSDEQPNPQELAAMGPAWLQELTKTSFQAAE